jgi:hypothetical protein
MIIEESRGDGMDRGGQLLIPVDCSSEGLMESGQIAVGQGTDFASSLLGRQGAGFTEPSARLRGEGCMGASLVPGRQVGRGFAATFRAALGGWEKAQIVKQLGLKAGQQTVLKGLSFGLVKGVEQL